MENWSPTIVYQLATERRRDAMARDEAARRLAGVDRGQSVRARLANTLVALAARLDPIAGAARQPATAPGATPA